MYADKFYSCPVCDAKRWAILPRALCKKCQTRVRLLKHMSALDFFKLLSVHQEEAERYFPRSLAVWLARNPTTAAFWARTLDEAEAIVAKQNEAPAA